MKIQWMVPVLLTAALVAGCGDNPSGGRNPADLRLEIRASGVLSEEETLAVGDTLQLTAELLNPNGTTADSGILDWRTSDSEVAQLRVLADQRVEVAGRTVGVALVIASSGKYSDTTRIAVVEPVTSALECAPGQPGVSLGAVGAAYATTGDKATTLCIEGGAEGAEFTVIPFNGAPTADGRLFVKVAAAGNLAVSGPPNPNLVGHASGLLSPRLARDMGFHARLMERSQAALLPRLRRGLRAPSSAPGMVKVPEVGATMEFNVEQSSIDGCSNPDYRTGKVVAVSDHAIVVADVDNPEGGFTTAQYDSIAQQFDRDVWPVDTENFGTPEDVDDNGHVVIFYTRAVNEMTSSGSNEYIGGFFYNRDLFPTTGKNSCAGSNHAEMFYMLVPDPRGEVNGNARSIPFVRRVTVGVLAHEFQHLINDSRRLYVNHASVWEEPWLNEGLSHIAEELLFYRISGMHPGQDIQVDSLRTHDARDAFNEYAADNVARYIFFLQSADATSLMGLDALATRGAAWSFLRYAADREAGGEQALWEALVKNSTRAGLDNLQAALGADPRDWMGDWAVSVYTDDAVAGVDALYQQPSWDFRALIPALHSNSAVVGRFPLNTRELQPNGSETFLLQGGAAAYVRFGVAPGEKAALRLVASNGLPLPSLLRVVVVRTK